MRHTRARLQRARRDVASFEGFCSPWYKQLLFVVAGVCTGGLLWLLAKWSLRVRTLLRLARCPLRDAQYVRTTVSAVVPGVRLGAGWGRCRPRVRCVTQPAGAQRGGALVRDACVTASARS
jgi:hypothetical protein